MNFLCKKWSKSSFPLFIYYNFFLNWILTWNFAWNFAMLLKCLMQKNKKTYPWKSDLCKLFLQKRPETCCTHMSQQVWKGQTSMKLHKLEQLKSLLTSPWCSSQPGLTQTCHSWRVTYVLLFSVRGQGKWYYLRNFYQLIYAVSY